VEIEHCPAIPTLRKGFVKSSGLGNPFLPSAILSGGSTASVHEEQSMAMFSHPRFR
jgi:hypothetical protein